MFPQRALHEMNNAITLNCSSMTQDLQEDNYRYHNTETEHSVNIKAS